MEDDDFIIHENLSSINNIHIIQGHAKCILCHSILFYSISNKI